MTWECRHLLRGQCMLRNCECVPGDKGCVLRGRYEFPLRDEVPKPKPKAPSPRSATGAKSSRAKTTPPLPDAPES